MHDIRAIREAPEAFDAALARRGLAPPVVGDPALDEARRACIQAAEAAQAERNAASKEVGRAKAQGDEAEFERLRALVAEKKDEIAALEEEAKGKDAALRDLLSGIPNLPYDDVPDGADEDDNVEIHRWGTPREFDFTPKEHFELTGIAPGMDFETAAKLSGSRFVLMSGAVARLHRALAQFMLDTHTEENGLTEVNGPRSSCAREVMYGTGQLPKFGEDSYETTNGWWLIPTSEVSLTNIVAGHIVEEDYLPRRYTAHSLCFRSEAGSAGRDTAGMLRQHQFEKVEMVSVTHPDASDDEQKRMLRCAEGILERSACPTAPWSCAPATWASARGAPTISRSGCRGRTPIARSPRSRPAAISRPGA
jgi:seryl-tRNA synthetase